MLWILWVRDSDRSEAEVACLCFMISENSAGQSQWLGANWWLRLESSKTFLLICLTSGWKDMKTRTANWNTYFVAFPCGLASLQHRSLRIVGIFTWYLRIQNKAFQWTKRKLHCLFCLSLEVTQCHFWSTLLAKATVGLLPLKGREFKLHLLMGKSQGHIVENHVR